MFALSFGNCCYNYTSESSFEIVMASKREYSSMDDFVNKAIIFLNTDEKFWDNYEEMYRNRIYKPVDYNIDEELVKLNERVNFLHEPVIRTYELVQGTWNNMTLILETESEYILYSWGTAA